MTTKVAGERSWRVIQGETLKCRSWEGDYIVFNPLSGQTHFLDIVTGQIITLLVAGSSTGSTIRSRVAAFLEVPDDEELATTVDDILIRLEHAGLIERLD